MRMALAVVAAASCSKADPPPPAQPAQPARVLDAQAAPQMIELLHHVPATVTVSSKVQNASIRPEHLVDGSFETAWNSRTGDLVGAWIDVKVPPQAAIRQVRMTVGHTGKGPKGEDYFMMNPRIQRIALIGDGRELKNVRLDVERRDLQTIDLGSAVAYLRIRIDAIVPGSKPTWREVCVSELEAWGNSAWIEPGSPKVVVAPPPPQTADALCDEFAKEREDYERTPRNDPYGNAPGPPACDIATADQLKLAPPWKQVATRCHTTDRHYAPWECVLAIETDGWWLGPAIDHAAQFVDAKVTADQVVVHYRLDEDWNVTCKVNRTCGEPQRVTP